MFAFEVHSNGWHREGNKPKRNQLQQQQKAQIGTTKGMRTLGDCDSIVFISFLAQNRKLKRNETKRDQNKRKEEKSRKYESNRIELNFVVGEINQTV